jgi:hypothetical protein
VFAQSLRSDHGDILQDIDWLLVSDDLAIRHREGARALDSIKILPTPSDSDCRTAKRIRSLIDPDSLQDITRVTRFSL